MDLVRTHAVELQQSSSIELHAAVLPYVDLGQPAFDAIGITLLVPCAIQRVGHIEALAVTADLDHLRCAVERRVRTRRMRLTTSDTSELHRAGLNRIERIGDVELLQLACAPTRDVQESIVERKVE